MNLPRYAIPIKEIISQHPHGILAKLSTQILSQKQVYKSLTQSFYLAPIKRHFILDEEGTGYYKYKKANEIPHVHCYAGGFHVKLKNQKDRHNIVQKGKLYKEKLKLALKFL